MKTLFFAFLRLAGLGVAAICATVTTASAFHIEFEDASGGSAHSKAFVADLGVALEQVGKERSAQPLVDLLDRYRGSNEIAELHYTLGHLYGQRTGLVDPDKSVAHFTKALEFRLPDRAYLDATMLRGNAFEQAGDMSGALDDYLRGLLAISYHDLSGGWPTEELPPEIWDHGSREAGELQKARDYRLYRAKTRLKQHLLRQRFYFVEAVKRAQPKIGNPGNRLDEDAELRKRLTRLAPGEPGRFDRILKWVRSKNKRPWP